MESAVQTSITLPSDLAETVRSKVQAGEYAGESDVVREGLRALLERDRDLEYRLRTEVASAYDALRADPERAGRRPRRPRRLAFSPKPGTMPPSVSAAATTTHHRREDTPP